MAAARLQFVSKLNTVYLTLDLSSSHIGDILGYTLNWISDVIIWHSLHCTLSLAAQCIVIGPVCLFVGLCVCLCVCLSVCYHDNSKLRASILTAD